MKFYTALIVASAFIVFNSAIEVVPKLSIPTNAEINATVEELKKKLETGIAELGIPPCNPLKIESLPLDFDSFDISAVKGQLQLDGLVVEGIPTFVLAEIKRLLSKLTIKIALPELSLKTDYDGKVVLFEFLDVYGTGAMNITLNGITADVVFTVTITGNGFGVSNTKVVLGLQNAEIAITGLLNDEEISSTISDELSVIVPQFLSEKSEVITKLISPIVEKLLNDNINSLLPST